MYRWNCCIYPTVMAPQNAVNIVDNENGPDETDTPVVVATDYLYLLRKGNDF